MANKRRERFYLDRLLACTAGLPGGEPTAGESPDFVLEAGLHRVGIEITEFHVPARPGERPFQEVQSLKGQAVATAERLHAQAGGPALYVFCILLALRATYKTECQRQSPLT